MGGGRASPLRLSEPAVARQCHPDLAPAIALVTGSNRSGGEILFEIDDASGQAAEDQARELRARQ